MVVLNINASKNWIDNSSSFHSVRLVWTMSSFDYIVFFLYSLTFCMDSHKFLAFVNVNIEGMLGARRTILFNKLDFFFRSLSLTIISLSEFSRSFFMNIILNVMWCIMKIHFLLKNGYIRLLVAISSWR